MVKVHFLNVGNGDCTVIEHDGGNLSIIDINNGEELDDETAAEVSEELKYNPTAIYNLVDQQGFTPYQILKALGYQRELENPVKFINVNYPNKDIWRFILTHPDMDHMSGLKVLTKEKIIHNFWDTNHNKEIEEFISDSEKEDWEYYIKLRKGGNSNIHKKHRGEIGAHFNQHPLLKNHPGDGLYILAPTPELVENSNNNENWNNMSYVLMLQYAGIKVIFGGDAEKDVWDSIVKNYDSSVLSCHILKASHHGRDSGFHEKAVEIMRPVYTIVSVGKKPDTDASNKYKKHTITGVWSTRWKGNVTVEIGDNGKFSILSQYDN
ncbi:conserved hypothetical protein [Candidatus Roizmanbacteria bacterium]|nr:conserved hypothetical protein [Candidatus Roizmanbacteria bacterium]